MPYPVMGQAKAFSSCVGHLGTLRLQGSVSSIPVLATARVAPDSQWWEPAVIHAGSIVLQELLPIVLACTVWRPKWRGSLATVHCDNMGAVAVVNSGYSKVPQIMHLLLCLFFILVFFHLFVWAVHIPGL